VLPVRAGRWRRLLGSLLLATGVAGIVFLAPRWTADPPRTDRDWAVDHAVAPQIVTRGDTVLVQGFRRFRYVSAGLHTLRWDTVAIDLRTVDRVWFALAPFGYEWMGSAHAFVTFGTSTGQYISISVEARRERDEAFGFRGGMTRQLELLYVVGDENDLLRQRVINGGYDLYVYPVVSPVARTQELLRGMLARAEQLRQAPEHYDLWTNNCTSNLVEHVNTMIPGRIPSGIKTLLPGFGDDVAAAIGLIDAPGERAMLRAQFRVNDVVRRLPDDSTFSAQLHAALDSATAAARRQAP
jgi:hypothetical protein